MAYAVVQVSSSGIVVGVKMVWLHVLHIAHGINQAIRWVHGDQNYTPIVVEAEDTPLTQITSSFKGIACHFEVNLYVAHEVAGLDTAYYESNIDIGYLLMLVIHLKDDEYGCHSTELKDALSHRGHKHTLHDELLHVVQGNVLHVKDVLDGAEVNVHQVETILAVECP